MNEDRVFFQGDGRLEGMLGWPEDETPKRTTGDLEVSRRAKGGVVVAHPYPPGGADMDLPVVYCIARECRRQGLASLRFNFRSVGASEGTFNGSEEHRDILAAVSFMKTQLASGDSESGQDTVSIGLAGWSFGSAMAARAAAETPGLKALALVGLPVHWENLPVDTLERLGKYEGPVLAVCAENDHHGAPREVEKALSGLGLDLTIEVVREADHYLQGRHREVADSVADFLARALTGA